MNINVDKYKYKMQAEWLLHVDTARFELRPTPAFSNYTFC